MSVIINEENDYVYIEDRCMGSADNFEKNVKKVNKKIVDRDIVVALSQDFDYRERPAISDELKNISVDEEKKIAFYIQQSGFGGFGTFKEVELLQLTVDQAVILFSKGFIQGAGIAIGRKVFDLILSKIKDKDFNKYSIGKLAVETKIDGTRLKYYFQKNLSDEENREAFDAIVTHIVGIDKELLKSDYLSFIWDRLDKRWILL